MAKLLYQGHGSFRLTTAEGRVIYVDPFAGEGYDAPADMILVTHQHPDHNCIDLPARATRCIVWTNNEAITHGLYVLAKTKFAEIESVAAHNRKHRKSECVGFIVTVDGVSVYFAGDTGKTRQMETFAQRKLDYAILPIDGTYTMDIPEAIKCAELIAAKHTIPAHTAPGKLFDPDRAKQLDVPGLLIINPGEEIELEKG